MSYAIPKAVNYNLLTPSAIDVWRQRTVTPVAQTAGSGGVQDGGQFQCTLQTASVGAVMDPQTAYLQFDMTITNANPTIDYASFGVEGVHSLFDEFQLYNQGAPLEQIQHYNICARVNAFLTGANQKEFSCFLKNRYENGYDQSCHRALIKPPMCDYFGNVMEDGRLLTSLAKAYPAGQYEPFTGTGYTIVNTPYSSNIKFGGINNQVTKKSGATSTESTHEAFYIGAAIAGGLPDAATAGVPTGLANNTVETLGFPAQTPSGHSPNASLVIEYQQKMGSVRMQDFFTYLSNVKNIPIGMTTDKVNANDRANGTGTLSDGVMVLNVCMPILSGIIGPLATKMFPTMCFSSQSLYFQMRLANARNVFRVSMDPCRRIVGTIREFCVNAGISAGPLGAISIVGGSAGGSATVQAKNLCVDNSLSFATYGFCDDPTNTTPDTGKIRAIDLLTSSMYSNAAAQKAGTFTVGSSYPQYIPCVIPATAMLNKFGVDSAIQQLVTDGLVEQSLGMYGTYLPESIPQSRKVRIGNAGVFSNNVTQISPITATVDPTIVISNINFVTEEIILPDELGSDIIRMLAQPNGITLKTQSFRCYDLSINRGVQQNIICPIKVASAKSMIFMFQNTKMRDHVDSFLYDSLSSINPFVSVVGSGTTGNPTVGFNTIAVTPWTSSITTSSSAQQVSSFSMQLRIGSQYMPVQPIRSPTELVCETIKSMHAFSNQSYSLDLMHPITTGGAINVFKQNGFFTPFTPLSVLDDQTVFSNPGQVKDGEVCKRGTCLAGIFEPLTSNCYLCFNLNSWNNMAGLADTGTFLNNQTITLMLTGANGLAVEGESYRAYCIVPHEAILNILPMGQAIWTY